MVRGKSEGLAVEIAGLVNKRRSASEERLLQKLLRIQRGEEVEIHDGPRVKAKFDYETRRLAVLEMLAKGPMYCKYIALQLHFCEPTARRCLEHEWFQQDKNKDNRWTLTDAGRAALEILETNNE